MATVRNLVLNSVDNLKHILLQIERSILLAEFSQRYLVKFLADGTLSKADLLDFYSGEEIKDRFRLIEREISELCV